MYWEQSPRRIWEYNPNIKLVFILRNPIQRAFSHWNMEYNRNAESEDFSYCIQTEQERAKDALPYQHRVYSYISRGYYSEQIRKFRCYFSGSQMLFIKYEVFINNQEEEILRLFDFLEVNPKEFNFAHETVHKLKIHGRLSTSDKEFLIDKFENDIHEVEKTLGWNCDDWLI